MDRSAPLALAAIAFAVVTGFAVQASAQDTMAAPPPPAPTPDDAPAPPAAHTGLQLGLRTGVAVPFGEVESGARMSDSFTPQVPITSIEATRNGVSKKSNGDLADPSLHEWLTLGLKVTFLP